MHGLRTWVLAALLISACGATTALAGQYPQNHDGWSIGLGVGGGSAGVSVDGGGSSDREGGMTGNFRLGYPLNPKVSLALESNGWTKSEDGGTVSFTATTIGVACFPSECSCCAADSDSATRTSRWTPGTTSPFPRASPASD